MVPFLGVGDVMSDLEINQTITGLRDQYAQRGFWVYYQNKISFFGSDDDFERWILRVNHELRGLPGVVYG